MVAGNAHAEFSHPQLDGPKHIRLMRLLPSDTATIHAELAVFSLDVLPDFMALSYCWATGEPEHRIILNRQGFCIRPNLLDCLQQVQSEGQHMWMFIDAICIDQSDLAEKCIQIGLMGDAYHLATEVVAWLGAVKTHEECTTKQARYEAKRSHDTNDRSEEIPMLVPATINSILLSEYWTRLWVIQELVLARTLTLQLGPLGIPFETFAASVTKVLPEPTSQALRPTQGQPGVPVIATVTQLKNAHQLRGGRSSPLYSILAQFSHQACSEPHDRVFGLLAISVSCITANDTTPLSNVYIQALLESFLQASVLSRFGLAGGFIEGDFRWSVLCFTAGYDWQIEHPPLSVLIHESTGKLKSALMFQMLVACEIRLAKLTGLNFWIRSTFLIPVMVALGITVGRPLSWLKWLVHKSRLSLWKARDAVVCMPGNTADAHTYSAWVWTIGWTREMLERRFLTREYFDDLLATMGSDELVMDGHRISQSDAVEALLEEHSNRRT